MTPVSLRLKNFLSYGAQPATLDFEQFSVACLSGGNGQGKSALLDAITWALWGEARKSADARKPDDELLRQGAREMRVEFVFDLDGARYRVERSYQKTASEKTSKPGLEFQVFDADAAQFRPLTTAAVRDTQAVITQHIGLDYDTFINSAFLLQGRSDEFTRKKPGERKEVLGKILGLDRYERMATRAGVRQKAAKDRIERGDSDVERLLDALENEGAWQTERAAEQERAQALDTERARLSADEAALADRLATLEATQREAERLRAALADLDARRQRIEADRADLLVKIAEADALVARAETIEAAGRRHEALVEERTRLDGQQDLDRGLERQHQKLQDDLDARRREHERKIQEGELFLRAARDRLADDDRRLLERPRAVEARAVALTAEEEGMALRQRADERKRLAERLDALDKQLAAEQGALRGQLTALVERVQAAERETVTLEELRAREKSLADEASAVEAWTAEQIRVRERGTVVAGLLQSITEEQARNAAEIAAIEAKRERLRTTTDRDCPTCGTTLTDAHRRAVDATYAGEIEALEARVTARQPEAETLAAERDALRLQFLELKERIEAKNGVASALTRVQEEIARHAAATAVIEADKVKARQIKAMLDGGAFLPAVRSEMTALREALDALPFDEAHYASVLEKAAHRARWDGTLRELDVVAARREETAVDLARREAETVQLRAEMDTPGFLADLRERRVAVERQRASVGYDGARHEAVRSELVALAGAPSEVHRLLDARRHLADWTAQAARCDADLAKYADEGAEHRVQLAGLDATLEGRANLAAHRDEVRRACATAESALRQSHAALGALDERLAACVRDRARLAEVREAIREARTAHDLYKHLRTAFGRNGIPSLIIEETLPAVEERANDLLDRLTSGRTRVHLETMKDKKAGGTKETLDIRVTDETGSARAYETFSGGEAFRVNFALRIALAQLLSERSGVRIRTLVVDEGFGTQDKEGVQNLVEAIRTIQDDFDKILIVTHMDELKDAFPVRIEVTKRPVEGSTFEIVGV